LIQLIKYLLFLILLISVKSYGTDTRSYAYYDSLTYDLYTHQQWKNLTIAGKDALSEGYDYYYLRIRIGVAYYELNNYRQSIYHLRKALQFNSADPVASEYLYYGLLKSGQNEEASLIALKHPSAAVPKYKTLEFIYTEGGYTPDAIKGHQAIGLMRSDRIYGEEDTYAAQTYFHIGAGVHVLPSLSCYLGYSNLNIGKEKHIAGSTFLNHLDSTSITDTIIAYFSSYGKIFDTLIPYKVKQQEFYFSAKWIPRSGLSITPAFHYISGTLQTYTPAYRLVPDTVFIAAFDTTWPVNYAASSHYTIGRQQNNFSNFVVSLAATMEWHNFSLGINGTYASLASSGKQEQIGAMATWFPFGNLNLYETTSLTGFFNKGDKRLIYNQTVGGKIAPKLWLEGLLTIGDLSLYNENNAFIVYNLSDRITMRTGSNMIFSINRHLDLSLMYRFYTKEYDYLYYRITAVGKPPEPLTIRNKYSNHSIIGGLKWKL